MMFSDMGIISNHASCALLDVSWDAVLKTCTCVVSVSVLVHAYICIVELLYKVMEAKGTLS